MDPNYASLSPHVPVVPRLLPSHYAANKTIPMFDDAYGPSDHRSRLSSGTFKGMNSSPSYGPIATRTQLLATDPQAMPFNANDFPPKGKSSNRIYHEPLKDNSNELMSSPAYHGYSSNDYPPYGTRADPSGPFNSSNQCLKISLILFALLIALFALTALTISIYLLVRVSNGSI